MDKCVNDSDFDKSLIEAIGMGLPMASRPYEAIARAIGSTEAKVIEGIQRFIRRGDIRRFGVVVRHRELGYRANGMVVWDIPDERIRGLGRRIGQYDFVTLCYRRPRRLPYWPYNLFSMIHGQNHSDVCSHVDLIAKQCGLQNIARDILFSDRCFKQRGASYQQRAKSPDRFIKVHRAVANG